METNIIKPIPVPRHNYFFLRPTQVTIGVIHKLTGKKEVHDLAKIAYPGGKKGTKCRQTAVFDVMRATRKTIENTIRTATPGGFQKATNKTFEFISVSVKARDKFIKNGLSFSIGLYDLRYGAKVATTEYHLGALKIFTVKARRTLFLRELRLLIGMFLLAFFDRDGADSGYKVVGRENTITVSLPSHVLEHPVLLHFLYGLIRDLFDSHAYFGFSNMEEIFADTQDIVKTGTQQQAVEWWKDKGLQAFQEVGTLDNSRSPLGDLQCLKSAKMLMGKSKKQQLALIGLVEPTVSVCDILIEKPHIHGVYLPYNDRYFGVRVKGEMMKYLHPITWWETFCFKIAQPAQGKKK